MERRGSLSGPREIVRLALLVLFIALTLRVLRYFPGMDIVDNVWLSLGAFYLAGPYLLGKVRSGLSFSPFELYVLFLIIVMPIVASVSSLNVFGQPLYYGLGTQRSVLLYMSALFLINVFRRGMIEIDTIESAFIILSWGTLCLYTAISLFVDPASLPIEGTLVKGGNIIKAKFNLNPAFIIFGFIYYSISGYLRRSVTQYALSIPFLLYIFFIDSGRAMLIAVLLSVMILVLRQGTFRRNILFSLRASVGIALTVFIIYSANSVYVLTYLKRLSDAFVVLFLGTNVADVSANQRIFETLTAIPYISEHWLIGCGRISNLWSGGYTGVMGRYFFPSDVGMIGGLFMYGFLGSLVYLVQFVFSWRFAKGIPAAYDHRVFAAAVTGYVWYFAIHSLVAGLFVHYLEVGLLMVAVLYCARFDAARHDAMREADNEKRAIS
jgi:hypothetical protein